LSALTEQLNEHLDKMDAEGGLSTLHLLSLPSSINRVLRLFLRTKQIDYEDLRKAVDGMPAENRLTYEELDEMLDVLCTRAWLVRSEEGAKTFYGINLRPAIASASAKSTSTPESQPSEGAAKASEAWVKAGMDSLGAPARSSSDIHKEMTGGEQQPAAEEETANESDDHLDKKKLSADDLWDVLD
jgi:hypothetical protein